MIFWLPDASGARSLYPRFSLLAHRVRDRRSAFSLLQIAPNVHQHGAIWTPIMENQ
jgi:hypothetical protein